jgi:hypothetical protein
MKTILRIAIILLAVVAIGGVTLALVKASSAAASTSETHAGNGGEGSSQDAAGQLPARLEGRGRGLHGNRIEEGTFSWDETLKNLIIVAIFIAAVVLFERLLKNTRRETVARVPVRSRDVERKE